MAQHLIDLLWRDHVEAPPAGRRGPRSRLSTTQVVNAAIEIADAEGLIAVTMRRLGERLGISTMAVYTHVNSRDDLLVLMADETRRRMPRATFAHSVWRDRARSVAESEHDLLLAHRWLLEIGDPRTALGPGVIAQYEHDLHAFDGTGLDDVTRDAAVTFVLDFTRAAVRAVVTTENGMGEEWETLGPQLNRYVGDDFPLATRVGAAVGESMQAAYSPDHAWRFGLVRVLDGLAALVGARAEGE